MSIFKNPEERTRESAAEVSVEETYDLAGKRTDAIHSFPTQLTLFQTFLPDNAEQYSNTIELYDAIPKYVSSPRKRQELLAELRDEKNGTIRPLKRTFRHRNKTYRVSIKAAQIEQKDGSVKAIFPGPRESLVEEALRKIASDKLNGVFLNNEAGVQFTLYELRKELARLGHSIHHDKLIESINICAGTRIELETDDGESMMSSSLFPVVMRKQRKDWLKNPKNTRWYVSFNPLVTASINQITYRQFNYQLYMMFKYQLSQWLHKKLSHYFIQASPMESYHIRMTTIVRDSGLISSDRNVDKRQAIKQALDELHEKDVLMGYVQEKEHGHNRKITDITYKLIPSKSFSQEIKKANKRINLQKIS